MNNLTLCDGEKTKPIYQFIVRGWQFGVKAKKTRLKKQSQFAERPTGLKLLHENFDTHLFHRIHLVVCLLEEHPNFPSTCEVPNVGQDGGSAIKYYERVNLSIESIPFVALFINKIQKIIYKCSWSWNVSQYHEGQVI